MECGLAVSPGIAIGKAFVYTNKIICFNDTFVETAQIGLEIERLDQALAGAKAEIRLLSSDIEKINRTQSEILKVHSQLVDDPVLKQTALDKIKNTRMNAPTALKYTIRHLEAIFYKMDTEYMRQRAVDIKDIGRRILIILLGIKEAEWILKEKAVIIAKELMPSDVLRFEKTMILGLVTETGGVTSHTAIIVRSAGIPAVTGIPGICDRLSSGAEVIVDGNNGNVLINPDEVIRQQYSERQRTFKQKTQALQILKNLPAVTAAGKRIFLGANIGSVDDITPALEYGAEMIGLFRTEFIYMAKNSLPGEDEQYGIYKKVIDGMKGRPVIFRTLDTGGDKNIPYLQIPQEDNPHPELRGIRFCLKNIAIFSSQLKAILRAGGNSEVTILLPMVYSITEVIQTRTLIDKLERELQAKGLPVGSQIKLGIMVEVPAAALIVKELAEVADYFSIGTNDLGRCLRGSDRTKIDPYGLYEHPALLKLIRNIVEDAHSKGKRVGVCGEMAGDTRYTGFLIEAGVDELSMNAVAIPEVKRKIIQYSKSDLNQP